MSVGACACQEFQGSVGCVTRFFPDRSQHKRVCRSIQNENKTKNKPKNTDSLSTQRAAANPGAGPRPSAATGTSILADRGREATPLAARKAAAAADGASAVAEAAANDTTVTGPATREVVGRRFLRVVVVAASARGGLGWCVGKRGVRK